MHGELVLTLKSGLNFRPKQSVYKIDTNVAEDLKTDVLAAEIAVSGGLYFSDGTEDLLEETIEDLVGMRITAKDDSQMGGVLARVEDVEEVPFEDLHRSYRCFLDVERFFPKGTE